MEILIRFTQPTKFDVYPHGKIWNQTTINGEERLFVQTSKDSNQPVWLRLGEVLECIHKEKLTNVQVEGWLSQFEHHSSSKL